MCGEAAQPCHVPPQHRQSPPLCHDSDKEDEVEVEGKRAEMSRSEDES
jgi:hypothetical protein